MAKKSNRIPIRKIVLAVVGFAVLAVILFWLAQYLEGQVTDETAPTESGAMELPSVLLMFGVGTSLLSLLSLIWLIWRIRDDRIPAWKRQQGKFGPKRR